MDNHDDESDDDDDVGTRLLLLLLLAVLMLPRNTDWMVTVSFDATAVSIRRIKFSMIPFKSVLRYKEWCVLCVCRHVSLLCVVDFSREYRIVYSFRLRNITTDWV